MLEEGEKKDVLPVLIVRSLTKMLLLSLPGKGSKGTNRLLAPEYTAGNCPYVPYVLCGLLALFDPLKSLSLSREMEGPESDSKGIRAEVIIPPAEEEEDAPLPAEL